MAGTGWTFMQDATVFLMFNDQGSPRGRARGQGAELVDGHGPEAPRKGQLTLTLMLSLDPATVGKQGYSHIFQIGESFEGNVLIDHQHPHDFLMQGRRVWRQPLTKGVSLTLAGAPVGEPALGPFAFMHRSSAAENPMSPARPPHVRFVALSRWACSTAVARSRPVPGRVVAASTVASRMRTRWISWTRRARLVVDPRLVPSVADVDLPGRRTDS
jgi:hypothetical protein